MTEEQKILSGKLFCPADSSLQSIKLMTHNLCTKFNMTMENQVEIRNSLITDIFACIGKDSFIQGPIYIHYGKHTHIGERFFANFNLTIQDDANVTIGDDCNFGPNVTIVTPIHPMLASERRSIKTSDGSYKHLCYAKPVYIGNGCWFGANVTICPGVTIGDNCVIGAGSVVTRDIPADSFAAGVPCKAIRTITESDSIKYNKQLFSDS